ncbi:YgaP family membrane protein [Aureibaculum conchae]|uniref:YgaP family membrane protein n=1 Tax=Aureibaculum sp. 2308TA14-22 TaxID=3108392 RepID=UPI0033939B6E
MKKNVGSIDKIVRIIIAVVAAYFAYQGNFGATISYVLYAVAGIMLLTSFMGSCPIYSVLGQSTCKVKE